MKWHRAGHETTSTHRLRMTNRAIRQSSHASGLVVAYPNMAVPYPLPMVTSSDGIVEFFHSCIEYRKWHGRRCWFYVYHAFRNYICWRLHIFHCFQNAIACHPDPEELRKGLGSFGPDISNNFIPRTIMFVYQKRMQQNICVHASRYFKAPWSELYILYCIL